MSEDIQRHLKTLPHGPGFRFLDRLTRIECGKSAEAEYHLRGDEWFLTGHFPGHPLMPGVLLIEAAAQLAGVAAQTDATRPEIANLKLVAVHHLKFFDTARPGDTITIQAELITRLENLVKARVVVQRGGQALMTGEVSLGGRAA
jgi:3-hydroxyacyl-[acyl-carrier-protein] dehydratase